MTGRSGRVGKARQPNVVSQPLTPTPTSEAAALRWAERKAAILRDHDVVTAAQLANPAGSAEPDQVSRVDEWRSSGRLFGVHDGTQVVYPLFQIKEGQPHPVVQEVLQHLRPPMADWEIFAWFTASDTWACRGRLPKDLLDDDPDAVIEAARHEVAERWD